MGRAIGVDVGGTGIKAGVVEGGKVVKRSGCPSPAGEGRAAMLNALFSVLEQLSPLPEDFVGIASAGNVNPISGEVVYATDNIVGWSGVRLTEEVSRRFGCRAAAENDAIAALLAEAALLPAPSRADVTMLTLGTGVGGASLVHGHVLRGERYSAGRWGHTVLVSGGRPCNCGRRGCAEQYVSGRALDALAARCGLRSAPQLLCADTEEAKEAVAEFAGYLNDFIGNVREVLAPRVILLGGGVAAAGQRLLDLVNARDDCVRLAALGPDAGIVGAAGLSG